MLLLWDIYTCRYGKTTYLAIVQADQEIQVRLPDVELHFHHPLNLNLE